MYAMNWCCKYPANILCIYKDIFNIYLTEMVKTYVKVYEC